MTRMFSALNLDNANKVLSTKVPCDSYRDVSEITRLSVVAMFTPTADHCIFAVRRV